ncbi:hypothetical protein [Nocardia huaxiensis]|uniref:hypothetical protein n=1 Tax=Nocardia huaxiensis TaxID=2755382 RepID=UPI001E3434CC|nr:hypothetical protein [Nocardia huaxiensis]UFS98427.1 hypothetical protein LPY97_11250 [Nocardia huaxiensis]
MIRRRGSAARYRTLGDQPPRAEAGPLTLDQHNVYEPLDGDTRLTVWYDLTLAPYLKPLSPILVRIVRTALQEALRKLAHNLETTL